MSTGPVEGALQQGLLRLDQSLIFGADRDFLSTLTMGQIIKGRVLRHYEGSRYGVEFGGQERVVDSAIALRSGDVIYGRVVGLDDKVHLQRIAGDGTAAQAAPKPAAEALAGLVGRGADPVVQQFQEHRATLNATELATVKSVGRQVGDLSLTASAALVLRKLGLPLDAALLRALTRAMTQRGELPSRATDQAATRLVADAAQRVTDNHDTVRLLAQSLEQLRAPERAGGEDAARGEPGDAAAARDANFGAGAGAGGDPGGWSGAFHQAWLLGRRILNSQTEGSVGHRFFTLPLWLGDRLLEINLAVFSQTSTEHEEDGIRYRRIVLSLDLAALGHVDVVVTVADQRLRIAFETEREEATQVLALWMGGLKSDLNRFGWEVDELTYGMRFAADLDWPARAVVSHYIRQDSLSRLM